MISAKDFEVIGVSHDIHFFEIAPSERPVGMAFNVCATGILPGFVLVMGRHFLPLGSYPPVKLVQHYVGEQWRQNAALCKESNYAK